MAGRFVKIAIKAPKLILIIIKKMKSIQIIKGPEYILEDSEAEYLQSLISTGTNKFVKLSNGDLINVAAISRIGKLEQKAHWGGYPLNDDKTGFWREGQFIHLEAGNFAEIEYQDDPKYLSMSPVKLLKGGESK